MINLVSDTINKEDMDHLIEWLKTYPRLTKGEETLKFEKQFSEYIGVKHSLFVNSGSSANLLMVYTLIARGLLSKGDKVIVPALSWATDLAPIIQFGLTPILCDCNMDNLSLELNEFERLCIEHKPKAVMFVPVLGIVPDMIEVTRICNKYDVILLEDVCESIGSEFNRRKLGTFGKMSSFSFYFGHHMSTIEGGMVCTDDDMTYNTLLSLRSHGWDRDMLPEYKEFSTAFFGTEKFHAPYTFYYPGFNLRSTDLQAVIGQKQLAKLDDMLWDRLYAGVYYGRFLTDNTWKPCTRQSNYFFAYPIISKNRDVLIQKLTEAGIETRPLICGSMTKQPVYEVWCEHKIDCPNAEFIRENGFYIPCHHDLTAEDVITICNIINEVEDE